MRPDDSMSTWPPPQLNGYACDLDPEPEIPMLVNWDARRYTPEPTHIKVPARRWYSLVQIKPPRRWPDIVTTAAITFAATLALVWAVMR